jgi:chemotaxis protein histidine kinase CheA
MGSRLMDKLRAHYLTSLKVRVETLEAALATLAGEVESPVAEDLVRHIAHTLKGSGATYGFAQISQAAAATEHASREALVAAAAALLATIREVILQAPASARSRTAQKETLGGGPTRTSPRAAPLHPMQPEAGGSGKPRQEAK